MPIIPYQPKILTTRSPTGPVVMNRGNPQAKNLYYWWPCNDTIGTNLPELVRGGEGTSVTNVTCNSFGPPDGGYSFLGGGAGSSITFTTVVLSTYTFSCWFYADGNGTQALFGSNSASARVTLNGNNWKLILGDSDGLSTVPNWTANLWTHVCVVNSINNFANIYINGVGTSMTASTSSATFNRLFTCNSGDTYSNYATDFRLYDTALSDSEAWALYDPATRWSLYYNSNLSYFFIGWSDTYTELPVMSGGNKLDAESLTVASTTVQRWRTEITGASASEIAKNTNTNPSSTDYGVVVRPIQTTSVGTTKRNSSVTTVAAQIANYSIPAIQGVQITASELNTDKVYVGPSGVTADSADATDGYPLAAGESTLVPTQDANLVYAIAGSGTQALFFVVL